MGMSRGDLKDLGELLDEGDSGLLIVAAQDTEARLDEAIKHGNKIVKKQLRSDKKDLEAALDEAIGEGIEGLASDYMSGDSVGAGQGAPGQVSGDAPAGTPTRVTRVRAAAAARGIPLATIITSVAVVALAYLAGKLLYRLRDVLLLIFVGASSP